MATLLEDVAVTKGTAIQAYRREIPKRSVQNNAQLETRHIAKYVYWIY